MFGYSIAVPERFEPLGTTFDPVARSMRALDDVSPEQEAERLTDLPQGFWEPDAAGVGDDGLPRPLRTLEMDCFMSERPLRQDKAAQMWFRMRRILPETLVEMELFRLRSWSTSTHTALGPVASLGFEFRWDGMKAHGAGGTPADRVGPDGHRGVPAVLPLPGRGVGRPAARVQADPGHVRAAGRLSRDTRWGRMIPEQGERPEGPRRHEEPGFGYAGHRPGGVRRPDEHRRSLRGDG